MEIAFFSGSDTGGLGAIMKKYMTRMGHTVHNIVWERTFTDRDKSLIDYVMMGKFPFEMEMMVSSYLRDADFIVVRNMNDYTLRVSGAEKHLKDGNFAYKVHGSDVRARGWPYMTEFWLRRKAPLIAFMELPLLETMESRAFYHVERPCDFELIPPKDNDNWPPIEVFHCLTKYTKGTHRGTKIVNEVFDKIVEKHNVNLHMATSVPYKELQKMRSKCHISIDSLRPSKGIDGYYGMSSVESWYQEIPVMMPPLDPIVLSMHPELEDIVIPVTVDNIESKFVDFIEDPTMFDDRTRLGKEFVKRVHNPERIAKQYIHLFESIMRR